MILFNAHSEEEARAHALPIMAKIMHRKPRLERFLLGPTGEVIMSFEEASELLDGVVPLRKPREGSPVRRAPRRPQPILEPDDQLSLLTKESC